MQYVARNRASFIDQMNPFVNRIFQHAIMQGDLAVVTLMLKHGIVVKRNQRNPQGLTALQQSVLDGNSRLAFMLLESGADMEAKTSNGWTCLHIASATGDMRIARLLLTHCADVVALTKTDELPIDLAMNMDMKILLANEMSRCGYIELSQWYMDKITQQEAGIFYVMSADSLLEIACDRPDPFSNQGYDFYNQNYMHTYSSMVNLSHHSTSEVDLASHKTRRPSAWTLAQQGPMGNRLGPTPFCDETYSHTLPTHGKRDQIYPNQIETSMEKPHDAIRKSSSASVIEQAEYLQHAKESFVNDRKNSDIQSAHYGISSSFQHLNTQNNRENITPSLGNRKNSLRRKKSSNQLIEQNFQDSQADNRLELTIDYLQNSLDYDQDYENDSDYLKSDEERRLRKDSSTSGSSYEDRGTDALPVHYREAENEESLYEDGNAVAGDRELLQEFADPYSSSSQFEIDTDNMEQYIIKSDGSVDQVVPHSHDDPSQTYDEEHAEYTAPTLEREDSSNGNMYFNPMYKSAEMPSTEEQSLCFTRKEEDSTSSSNSESHHDIILDWQVNEGEANDGNDFSRHDKSPFEKTSKDKRKPFEIYSEETELICDETEFVERKRKKKGIFSELVSRFKKTSTKMQRTSSDTNLHHNEENSIIRRDTRKVKTLRRRRHVRRSNSFSSYFTQGDEKAPKAASAKKDEINRVKEIASHTLGRDERNSEERRDIAPPYSPHRRQKVISELTAAPISQIKTNQMYASLPHRGSRASRSAQKEKKCNALGFEGSWLPGKNYANDDYKTWEPRLTQNEVDSSWINEKGISRIPTR